MGLWRGIYKLMGMYDNYPETIPQDNINKKNMMIKELKSVFERHHIYKNKILFDLCVLQLKLMNSKKNTLDMLVNLNIKLL